MDKSSVLVQYLSVDQQKSLINDLIQKDLGELVHVLDSIEGSLDAENRDLLFSRIVERVEHEVVLIDQRNEHNDIGCDDLSPDMGTYAHILFKVPALWERFEHYVRNIFVSYVINNNYTCLSKETQKLFKSNINCEIDTTVPVETLNVVTYLAFLERVFLEETESKHLNVVVLDKVLLFLQACNAENIAVTSSKLMRWAHKEIVRKTIESTEYDSFLWELLSLMITESSDREWKQRICLSFLLRVLSNDASNQCLRFIQSNAFWQLIHTALNHSVHEYRKLGLSIMKLAIRKLDAQVMTTFHEELFYWYPEKKNDIIESWKRYTTIYELVALDTALNQIQDARLDIIDLFNDENLPPSWGLILLSTGLMASMESVRKYIVTIMLDIKNPSVFSSNLTVLRTAFLPALMFAHFFNTEGRECPHGDKLAQFVSQIIESSNVRSDTISTILQLLIDQGTAFDPARIYVAHGLLSCLSRNFPRSLNLNHLNYLRKLFEFECEEEIFETTLQTIYLKLLLHMKPATGIFELLSTLVTYVKCQGGNYKYLRPMIEDFRDYCTINFESKSTVSELKTNTKIDSIFDAIASTLFDDLDCRSEFKVLIQLIKMDEIQSTDNESIVKQLSKLLEGIDDDDVYLDSYLLTDAHTLATTTWNAINIENLYLSLRNNFGPEKFKFFVSIYTKVFKFSHINIGIAFNDIGDIYEVINEHLNNKNAGKDFKYKDSLYQSYFALLLEYMKCAPVGYDDYDTGSSELNLITNILKRNIFQDNGYYKGNLGVTDICQEIINSYLIPVSTTFKYDILRDDLLSVLTTIWDNISGERLILKEKKLHLRLISTLFNPYLILACTGNTNCVETLKTYGIDIVSKSYSRRSLLPTMAKRIAEFFQMYYKKLDSTTDSTWMISILVSIFTNIQMNENVFKLKPVISQFYDRSLSTFMGSNSSLYKEVYGDEEFSARIYVIYSILSSSDKIKEHLVTFIINDTKALKPIKRTDGVEGLERLLLWQLILISIVSSNGRIISTGLFTLILKSIEDESSPLVRICKEWSIAQLITETDDENQIQESFDYLFSNFYDHSQPVLAVSVEKIVFITLKTLTFNKKHTYAAKLLERFVSALVANCTSNKPLVRHFSNSLVLTFWPLYEKVLKDETVKSILKKLYDNAEESQVVGKYRAGDANVWDLVEDCNLTALFGGVLKKTIDHDIPYLSAEAFSHYLLGEVELPIGNDEYDKWLDKRANKNATDPNILSQNAISDSLQTKSGAWETVLDIDQKRSNEMIKRSDLIVVSSLVDKPPNLGGICRLCDVLGVGLLTVQDLRVRNHPQFKNVAVTADKWMPMAEVPVDGISEFMREKKKEGYTLIGLEQTDKSVQLDNDFRFPKKSLILLGTEAHGIPGHLLNELDLCLEIKQHGVIRSMNIQTATAVIVHSYTVQIL
ncbi:tRNA (guanosine(18)-2'-O)-methyltransferase [Nakaseomyces bracarensis]|uniref:tRNA (Guanosine(18)-2'-O)-methyltransferase n=1 Tax=Nakaseomyces bracarensis TaxID=273131 RepID=A0ABR4NMA0_9SACH